jgi:citrate synthase
VHHGRLIYRGQDAVDLAAGATLEDVAQMLWQHPQEIAFRSEIRRAARDPFVGLASLVADGRHLLGRHPRQLAGDAASVVGTLAGAIGARNRGGPVHERLARGWGVGAEGVEMIRRALVLVADHELNASTFAVRVAASTGASLSASLLAGLSALSGPRHGGAAERMMELVRDAERSGAERAVGRWLAREQKLPGFDHPLYPDGDPRAAAILAKVRIDPLLTELRDVVAAATGGLPNVDFALAGLVRAHALPGDAAFRLFALGRSVGWAAHALEQSATGQLIRPRGVYVGPMVVE